MHTNKRPRTLLEIAGVPRTAATWSDSVLVIIDAQEFYRTGTLQLHGIGPAIAEARRVLDGARANGAPVIHVMQQSKPGSEVFSESACRILKELTPVPGEAVVTKAFPDSFAQTDLEDHLQRLGCTNLILIGFMTHMCVSTSVRSAVHRGFRCTIVADACATRDLPDMDAGTIIAADVIHRAELAALADRFAQVVKRAEQILP